MNYKLKSSQKEKELKMTANDIFKIQDHELYQEKSKTYKIKESLANECLSKFDKSSELCAYIGRLFLYEVNGLLKVDWEKFLSIKATPDNIRIIRDAAKQTLKDTEYYNPVFTKRLRDFMGVKYSIQELEK